MASRMSYKRLLVPPCMYHPGIDSMGGRGYTRPHAAWRIWTGSNPRTFGHPGAGGSISWADPDTRLAVAMTHNRMFRASTPEENPFVPIDLLYLPLKIL